MIKLSERRPADAGSAATPKAFGADTTVREAKGMI
jgi:hypothetical protein